MAGHSQIKIDDLVEKYSREFKSANDGDRNSCSIEFHLEEFENFFDASKNVYIKDVSDFLSSLFNRINSKQVLNKHLALVCLLERVDCSGTWTELELKKSDGKFILSNKNYFTPPSLYLLGNPLDLLLYNLATLKNLYDSTCHVLLKQSNKGEDYISESMLIILSQPENYRLLADSEQPIRI